MITANAQAALKLVKQNQIDQIETVEAEVASCKARGISANDYACAIHLFHNKEWEKDPMAYKDWEESFYRAYASI